MAAPVLMAASSGLSAIGSLTSGISRNNAAKFNANVADQNAVLAAQAGSARADQVMRSGRQTIGEQIAETAQNGGGFGGSGGMLLDQSWDNLVLDAMTANYRGAAEANDLHNQARIDRFEGKQALFGGILGAGANLLSGAGALSGAGKLPFGLSGSASSTAKAGGAGLTGQVPSTDYSAWNSWNWARLGLPPPFTGANYLSGGG